MNNYPGSERRKHPRVNRPFIVAYRKSDFSGGEARVTQLRNISEGGFAFRSDEEFKPGEILDLHIRLPSAREAIKAKGQVVASCRVSQRLFCETRVIFTEISEEAKGQIRETVKQLKR